MPLAHALPPGWRPGFDLCPPLIYSIRREMKGLSWGVYYNKYSHTNYDANILESRINSLMQDEDVTKPSGIYEYLLDGQEKHLNIRAFTDKMKRAAYERQGGVCPRCGQHFELSKMHADHIIPWSKGGSTTKENCQMLCADCNRRKSDV